MKLTDEKIGLLFKMLASKSLYETGIEFGFDKHYSTPTAVKNAVYRVYQKALREPEKYAIQSDTFELVTNIVSNRSVSKVGDMSLKEKQEAIDKADIKTLVLEGRKKAWGLLNQKMDRIGSSRKRLDEVNLSTLAQTFGIIFDKAQIISGEATENVALMAKINTDMTPEEALKAVLQMREMHQVDKDRSKKK